MGATLALDIGNTRIKAGLFRGTNLTEVTHWPIKEWAEVLAYAREASAEQVVWAAVVPVEETILAQLAREVPQVLEITHHTLLPFSNTYQTPHTLGRDRLAAVAGAHALWPGKNCLVIDAGTCIKYDLLTAEGAYLGGNISPGASMRLRALNAFTAQLPLVPVAIPEDPIGRSTTTALQNGALRGAALEVAGFAETFRHLFPHLTVVLTGGDATFFTPLLPFAPLVEPNLTLHGLNHLLLFNTNPRS